MLRLTLLAPDVVVAILDGRQPEGMRLEKLMEGFPDEWAMQREYISAARPSWGVIQRSPALRAAVIALRARATAIRN